MLVVLAKLTVRPEKKSELLEYAKALIAATRLEEECISYELLEDPYDASNLMFVERWTEKMPSISISRRRIFTCGANSRCLCWPKKRLSGCITRKK